MDVVRAENRCANLLIFLMLGPCLVEIYLFFIDSMVTTFNLLVALILSTSVQYAPRYLQMDIRNSLCGQRINSTNNKMKRNEDEI
jgi:hypothetical protein